MDVPPHLEGDGVARITAQGFRHVGREPLLSTHLGRRDAVGCGWSLRVPTCVLGPHSCCQAEGHTQHQHCLHAAALALLSHAGSNRGGRRRYHPQAPMRGRCTCIRLTLCAAVWPSVMLCGLIQNSGLIQSCHTYTTLPQTLPVSGSPPPPPGLVTPNPTGAPSPSAVP